MLSILSESNLAKKKYLSNYCIAKPIKNFFNVRPQYLTTPYVMLCVTKISKNQHVDYRVVVTPYPQRIPFPNSIGE
jgi:hypothetical protein